MSIGGGQQYVGKPVRVIKKAIRQARPRGLPLLLVLLILIGGQTACKPSDFVTLAERSGSIASKLKPVIQPLVDSGQLPASLPGRIDQFRDVTRDLAEAFRNSSGDALALTSTAIQLVETFIDKDAQLIKDPAKRMLVLAILSVADIALGEIADRLTKEAEKAPLTAKAARTMNPTAASTVETFAKKPRLRCRNSATGRFEKMSVCEANPATTVVERIKN